MVRSYSDNFGIGLASDSKPSGRYDRTAGALLNGKVSISTEKALATLTTLQLKVQMNLSESRRAAILVALGELHPIWDGVCRYAEEVSIPEAPPDYLKAIEQYVVDHIFPQDPKSARASMLSLFTEINDCGMSPNISWASKAYLTLPPETYAGDHLHANTIDMAIHTGNKVALELLLQRSSIGICTATLKDLMERNALNVVYSNGHCRAWVLSDNHRFGLLRLILNLSRRCPEVVLGSMHLHLEHMDKKTKKLVLGVLDVDNIPNTC